MFVGINCRCTDCEAVIMEQVQYDNNSAIHGGALDINASTPTPVVVVASEFMSNTARIISDDPGTNTSIVLAGNGGGIRCLGGDLPLLVSCPFLHCTPATGAILVAVDCFSFAAVWSGHGTPLLHAILAIRLLPLAAF